MPTTQHNQIPLPEVAPRGEDLPLALGAIALEDVRAATEAFYGATGHFVGRTLEGEYRSLVSFDEGVTSIEVGAGDDVTSAVGDTLAAMHSLETAQTKPILRMPVRKGATVDFTKLEHYAPKIAPGNKTYETPAYLADILRDDEAGLETYKKTIATEGWSEKLFTQVETFLSTNPKAAGIMQDLKITSLRALTPEQAVKVSLATVQRLSKYSRNAQGRPDGKVADVSTTMQLLQAGMEHADDPTWRGNGVCRNIAGNVKAVFEALKQHQGNLSMLNNTYAVYTGGSGGAGYRNERQDTNSVQLSDTGHAWNTFVTVDARGSASVAIVDATWALGRNSEEADYTMERMATAARTLFEESDDKPEAFDALNDYYTKLARIKPGEGPAVRQRRNKFIMTEYLEVAAAALPEAEHDAPPIVPSVVTATAYQLKDMLDPREVQTLYGMGQAGWISNFDTILHSYLEGKTSPVTGSRKISKLVVHDEGLQNAIFAALGERTTLECAEQSADFRARLREFHPALLPAIDPARLIDRQEISALAERQGLHLMSPSRYGAEMRNTLRRYAPDDASFEATVKGYSDYALLRNFRRLAGELQNRRTEVDVQTSR